MNGDFLFLVLAGGEGRRMGGDKPLRPLGGRTLVDRALDRARTWGRFALAVREEGQWPQIEAERLVDDPGLAGPLAGIASGLGAVRARGLAGLVTLPCDMPFLPDDLPRRLAEAEETAVVASSAGRLHPVCALWRPAASEILPSYIATGRRSLEGFARLAGMAVVEWPVRPVDPFFNINDPGDLQEAERLARSCRRDGSERW